MTVAHWVPLQDGWRVRAGASAPDSPAARLPTDIPATVPGCVHLDLLSGGHIDDPYLDQNESTLNWIGDTEWVYATSFAASADDAECVDLVCHGLDTVATVRLNRHVIARTQNMHRSYRVPLDGRLLERNNLAITFSPVREYAHALEKELGPRPSAYPEPFNFVRKMACNFGWDWGPNLVTAGIWRPIGLHRWSTARLAAVRPRVELVGGHGEVRVEAAIEWAYKRSGDPAPSSAVRLVVEVDGTCRETIVAPGHSAAFATVAVASPALWWPRGFGNQALYKIAVSLVDDRGNVLDVWRRRIGFRTIELDTAADASGSAFTFIVNGLPIFVRGANWIPDDCFPSRVDPNRYRTRIAQAVEGNVNLLRVWGGGIYEADDFFDICDEEGVLVWQDFLFACAAYPEEEPIRQEVQAEAEENVTRLMAHPSLVLWNGNNENIWGWFDWGWREQLQDRSWGQGYYLEHLSRTVANLDPTRPYWPGSPYSGSMDIHPNDERFGSVHSWRVWNEIDYAAYTEQMPRFVAEFGFQGPPTLATIASSIHDKPLTPTSPGMLAHQKAVDGSAKLARAIAAHMRPARDFDDWLFKTQVNQGRAIAYGIEHWRSLRPLCMGTVVWQLNDCWPVTSWAVIDGDGRLKPAWYALRRAYAPRLLTIQPRSGGLSVFSVNDAPTPWPTWLTVRRMRLDGRTLAEDRVPVTVDPSGSVEVRLPSEMTACGDPAGEFLVAEASSGERAIRMYAEDRDLADTPALDVTATPCSEGYELRLTAQTLIRDLCVFADRLDPAASVTDTLLTLLPGESRRITVMSAVGLEPSSLTKPPILRFTGD